jgi:hypothetical protein
MLIDIVVGIVGAFVAGYLLTPLLGIGTINQNNFSLPALLVSLGGRRHPAGGRQSLPPGKGALTVFHSVRQTPWSGRHN